MYCDVLWHNARLMTLDAADGGLGIVDDGILACQDGRIAYAGPAAQAPALKPDVAHDCQRRWISPGLIDCHTHLVYAGNRANEFEQRLRGASYAEIAAAGGGIVATVRATRAADDAALLAASLPRLDAMLAEGVTTLEIKSGYGLTLEDETKQLRVARQLATLRKVEVVPTFLGAHAVPPGGDAQGYIDAVCTQMIPAIAAQGLAGAGTVAVLLPGAFYFTRDTQLPPIAALRAAGVPLALATDCNPGTSPLTSPLLAMNMAATLFRMTVDECIAGFTRHAARALGRGERLGRLRAGMHCDLAIWDIDAPADLVYRMGFNPLHARVWRGHSC
ncbi:amidohydrolase family protein [Xanthomonas sp. BRIP62418]|uniref:amidohydrolase family protein n=1 Tax=Xanthomonas sp. BRIP62418 TaxID=2182391 RepID=UPI000F8C458F|nr:amidohydrolase family protein [Xanthomonas sp. BRIP62418]